jgi:RNA polymerase sigma factor (sigma-70 family)
VWFVENFSPGCNAGTCPGVFPVVRGDRQSNDPGPLDAGFERFVIDASPGLLRSAYLLTRDRRDAEDLLQTALIRTMRRWRSITGSPLAYTFVALVNLSHDRQRAQRRRPQEVPDSETRDVPGNDPIDRLLERDLVVRAAGRLSASQRGVLACRFLLDMSVVETAAALRMPEGTVKSHCSRALARMREILDHDTNASAGMSREVRDVDR